MKTLVVALSALFLIAGVAPMAIAQQDSSSPAAQSAPAPAAPAADKAPDMKAPGAKADVDVKAEKTDTSRDSGGGLASPRSESVTRTTFFGLSPTAAIIVSVAVLLVVILAIVAMTNSGGTTYVDKGDRRL